MSVLRADGVLSSRERSNRCSRNAWPADQLAFVRRWKGRGELFRAFAARSPDRLFWEVGAFTNVRLLGVVTVSVFLQVGLHHIPATQALFQIRAIPLSDCALGLALGLIPVPLLELGKLARRRGASVKP